MSATDKKVNKRRRRSQDASRDNILEAAERVLTAHGPLALKLTEVARAAGIATATVLHHFGSVAGLQAALMERMVTRLAARVIEIEAGTEWGPESGLRTAQALFDAFEEAGAARLAAWLEMSGEARRLSVVRRAMDEVLESGLSRHPDGAAVSRDALERFILASITAALGAGLFGRTLSALLGRPEGAAREAALDVLTAHMAAARLY